MKPEPEVAASHRATALQVSLKAAALIHSMSPAELALFSALLRSLSDAPRRGRAASARDVPTLAPERSPLPVPDFLAKHTAPNIKGRIRTTEFMQRFSDWARVAGVSQYLDAAEVYAAMAQAGYPKRKSNGQHVFAGFVWKAEPTSQAPEGEAQ